MQTAIYAFGRINRCLQTKVNVSEWRKTHWVLGKIPNEKLTLKHLSFCCFVLGMHVLGDTFDEMGIKEYSFEYMSSLGTMGTSQEIQMIRSCNSLQELNKSANAHNPKKLSPIHQPWISFVCNQLHSFLSLNLVSRQPYLFQRFRVLWLCYNQDWQLLFVKC